MKNLYKNKYSELLDKDSEEKFELLLNRNKNGLEKAFFNHRILNHFIKTTDEKIKPLKQDVLNSLSDKEFESLLNFFKKDNIIKLSSFKNYIKCLEGCPEGRLNKFFNNTSNLLLLRNSFQNIPELLDKLNVENKIKLYSLVLYTKPFLDVNISAKPIIDQARQNQKYKSFIINKVDKEKINSDDNLLAMVRLLELNNAYDFKCMVEEKRFPSFYVAKIINSEHLLELIANQPISLWVECIKNSKEIMKTISNIKDPMGYFNIYRNIERSSNSAMELEELREKFYKKEFAKENLDNNYIDYFYMRYFGDNKNNVNMNIETLLKFIEAKNDENIAIPKSFIGLYKDIIGSKSIEDYKELSNKFEKIRENYKYKNNINEDSEILSLRYIQSVFYDHFLVAREESAKSLLDGTFKQSDLEKQKNEILSRELGKDVYTFNGQPIGLFVHTSAGLRENVDYSSVNKYWQLSKNRRELETDLRSVSLSYITDKKFKTYKDIKNNVTFAFLSEDLRKEQMATINDHNVCTKKSCVSGNLSFDSIKQDLLPLDEFIKNIAEDDVSEIVYSNDVVTDKQLIPQYILCADKITNIEKRIAEDLKIKGFIVVDTKKYNYNNVLSNPFIDERTYDI